MSSTPTETENNPSFGDVLQKTLQQFLGMGKEEFQKIMESDPTSDLSSLFSELRSVWKTQEFNFAPTKLKACFQQDQWRISGMEAVHLLRSPHRLWKLFQEYGDKIAVYRDGDQMVITNDFSNSDLVLQQEWWPHRVYVFDPHSEFLEVTVNGERVVPTVESLIFMLRDNRDILCQDEPWFP
jgi:hypothetical protein